MSQSRQLWIGLLAGLLLYGQESNPARLLEKAAEQQKQGDTEGAVKSYRDFLALRPNEVPIHSNLGVLLARLGRFDEAISEYRKALDIEPGNASILLNLGLAYYKSGRITEAAKEFSDVHAKLPENQQTVLLLADCDFRMGKLDQVIELLKPLEERNPNDLAIAYLLGTAYIRDNKVEEGQQRVDRILKNGDSAEARFLLGSQMLSSGDIASALKEFSRAVELNPNLPSLQSFYGKALLNTGDPDAAAQAFRKELAADPTDFEANLYLAEILIHRERWSEAQALLNRALLVRPDSDLAKGYLAKAVARQDLTSSAAAVNQPGPQPGELAPEFRVTRRDSGETVTLRQMRNAKPAVLVFGSYTCPNFRAAAETLNQLYAQCKGQIGFYLIYIREAHSTNDWQSTRNQREGIKLSPAANMSERRDHATMCIRKLKLDFPAFLDSMAGTAEKSYSAWPSRVYVIDPAGRIAFNSGLTELDFKPDLLVAAIKTVTTQQSAGAEVEDAIAKQRAGDLEGAVKEYREFLKLHPQAAAIHSNLGAALAGLGRFSEAVEAYQAALKLSPSMTSASLNLALAYYKMSRIPDAVPLLVKVHRETPANSQATLVLADCYLRMNKNSSVIDLLRPLQRTHPDDLAIAYLLGTALIRDNQVEQGQILVDRILRNGDSAEAHLMLGSAKMQVKDFVGAREEFAKAVALNPKLTDAHELYGQALQATGDPDAAVREFTTELAADPYNFDSNLAMGVLLRQTDNLDQALPYLTRALSVRPGDFGVRYQLAAISVSQGKLNEARSQLESIIKDAPQFTEAHVSLATVYYRLKLPADGNRERQIVQRLTAEAQAKQPGVTAWEAKEP